MTDTLIVAALDEEIAALRARHPDANTLVTGPGKVLAAAGLAARLALDPPELVLVLGTAGALNGLRGVHEISEVAQHDFAADAIAALVGRRYGDPIALAGPTNPDGPRLATGDVFVADVDHAKALADRGFSLVDMEGYAYASVCAAAGVAVRIVKAVSDEADETAVVSWAETVARCGVVLADWYGANVV